MSNQIKQAGRPPRHSRTSGRRLAREMNTETPSLGHQGKENGERRRAVVETVQSEAPKPQAAAVQTAEAETPPKAGLLERMKAAVERWKESDGSSESPVVLGFRAGRRELRRLRRRLRHILRENKAHRFPESDHGAVQLLLFGFNMLPTFGSRVREAVWGRRKRAMHQPGRLHTWMGGRKIHPAAFLGAGCALALAIVLCSS